MDWGGRATNGSFSAAGHTAIGRVGHTATLLDDGTVLVAGGRNLLGVPLASCEIYEPATKRFLPAAPMRVARDGHTATLLPDGTVLVVGGESLGGRVLKSTEIYEPASGRFLPGPSLTHPRVNHTTTMLSEGAALIAGGQSDDRWLLEAKIFDFRTQTFVQAGSMGVARSNHTATALGNGKVLIVGGENIGQTGPRANGHNGSEQQPASSVLPGAELFDTATRTFAPCSERLPCRNFHTATPLSNGKVLIAGSVNVDGAVVEEAFIYDPDSDAFMTTATGMVHPRANHAAATLTRINDGVLLSGGFNANGSLRSAEEYEPMADAFAQVGDMATERNFHTATLLKNGEILIVGGEDARGRALDSAELYRP